MQSEQEWQPRRPYLLYGLVAFAAAAVLFLVTQWQTINDWTRHKPTAGALSKMAQAQQVLLSDSFVAYAKADELLQLALVESPKAAETNAAFAELQFRWADALRYQTGGDAVPPVYHELLKRGRACAEAARVQAPDLPIVRRALAAMALFAEPPDLATAAEVLDFSGATADAWTVFLQGKIAMLTGAGTARQDMERVLTIDPTLLRAHYELAQLALRGTPPDVPAARRRLQTLLAAQPSHELAAALLEKLDVEPAAETD